LIGGSRLFISLVQQSAGQKIDIVGVLLLLIGTLILWSGEDISARNYPVIINAGMLSYFGWTLLSPQSAVERLARLSDPDLPAQAVGYTRRVTMVWCLFFLINASIALYTALWSTLEIWTLYNGLIAYVAMGVLFSTEYVIRRFVMRRIDSQNG
jgi:uncharacterized membrane protein